MASWERNKAWFDIRWDAGKARQMPSGDIWMEYHEFFWKRRNFFLMVSKNPMVCWSSFLTTSWIYLEDDLLFWDSSWYFLQMPSGSSWQAVPAYPHADMRVEHHLLRISSPPGLQMLVTTFPLVNNPEFPLAPSGSSWQSVPGSQIDHKHALDSSGMSLHDL